MQNICNERIYFVSSSLRISLIQSSIHSLFSNLIKISKSALRHKTSKKALDLRNEEITEKEKCIQSKDIEIMQKEELVQKQNEALRYLEEQIFRLLNENIYTFIVIL